jgi:hypothetical protein
VRRQVERTAACLNIETALDARNAIKNSELIYAIATEVACISSVAGSDETREHRQSR